MRCPNPACRAEFDWDEIATRCPRCAGDLSQSAEYRFPAALYILVVAAAGLAFLLLALLW